MSVPGDLSQAEEPSLKNFLVRRLCYYPSTASWVVYTEQQCASMFACALGAAVIAHAI